MAVEFDGMTFKTSLEKDNFLKDRETHRVLNKNWFAPINERNGNRADVTDAGVWSIPRGQAKDPVAFHVFNDPQFESKIKNCRLFKIQHPEWRWS